MRRESRPELRQRKREKRARKERIKSANRKTRLRFRQSLDVDSDGSPSSQTERRKRRANEAELSERRARGKRDKNDGGKQRTRPSRPNLWRVISSALLSLPASCGEGGEPQKSLPTEEQEESTKKERRKAPEKKGRRQKEGVLARVDFWFSPLWLSLLLTTRGGETESKRAGRGKEKRSSGIRVEQPKGGRAVRWEVGKRVSTSPNHPTSTALLSLTPLPGSTKKESRSGGKRRGGRDTTQVREERRKGRKEEKER